jgi:hypothetical protein
MEVTYQGVYRVLRAVSFDGTLDPVGPCLDGIGLPIGSFSEFDIVHAAANAVLVLEYNEVIDAVVCE